MHELSIASSIIDIVKQQLEASGVGDSKVEKIVFLAGAIHAVIPDALTFHFDVVKKDHPPLVDTFLEIQKIPVKTWCPGCGREDQPTEPSFICDECHSPLVIREGEELRVESIEVEDDEE